MLISEMYDFAINRHHEIILPNKIFKKALQHVLSVKSLSKKYWN